MRQCIGIPMGIDPAPFWANLYLYFYEENYISNLIQNNKAKAKKFNFTKRFIDDLIAINDDGEFGRECSNIYPAELELKEEHNGVHATFLNLDNRIEDRKFVYKMYDKREEFQFSIVKLPHRESNIPANIFYSALAGEFLRIARSSLLFVDFLPKAKDLIKRMISQGAEVSRVENILRKMIASHSGIFSNFPFLLKMK